MTTKQISPETLAEWQRLAEQATPGPWMARQPRKRIVIKTSDTRAELYISDEVRLMPDAQFIAVARDALPELIGEVERLRELLLLAHKTLAVGPISEFESTMDAIEKGLA